MYARNVAWTDGYSRGNQIIKVGFINLTITLWTNNSVFSFIFVKIANSFYFFHDKMIVL